MMPDLLLAFIDPFSAITLGLSALGLFGGRGGGDDDANQNNLLRELLPDLRQQIEVGRIQNLRNALRTDPGLFAALPAQLQNPAFLPQRAVPLQEAVTTLAFGLLPRFSRDPAFQVAQGQFGGPTQRVLSSGQVGPHDPTTAVPTTEELLSQAQGSAIFNRPADEIAQDIVDQIQEQFPGGFPF